jgi:hypothetical protein
MLCSGCDVRVEVSGACHTWVPSHSTVPLLGFLVGTCNGPGTTGYVESDDEAHLTPDGPPALAAGAGGRVGRTRPEAWACIFEHSSWDFAWAVG